MKPMTQVTETRVADTVNLPRRKWKCDERLRSKYESSNRKVGKVYDSSVVLWMRKRGIPIPEARSEFFPEWMFNTQFFNYWEDGEATWDPAAFAYAKRQLARSYSGISDLEMAEYDDVSMDILLDPERCDKSAGLPSLGHKSDVMEEDLGRAKAIATGRVAPPPNVAYHRTQEGKVRIVWGCPLSVLLLEGRFMLPIQKAIRHAEVPYCYGYTSSGIQGRLAALSYTDVQYCLDWSKFDSTMPRRVIHEAFDVIRSWFSDVDETTWEVVKRYFVTCPLLMPDGYIYTGRKRGIPSGSWFTQLLGSMCNEFLVRYLSYLTGDHIAGALFMGDDSVLGLRRMPNVVKWAELAKGFGMTIHPSKQRVTHGKPHFLMHHWGDAWPTRPVAESLNRLATSERYKSFDSKHEAFEWSLDKAKSLIIDNPMCFELVSDYIAWRYEIPPSMARIRLAAGDLITGSTIRRGWAEADTSVPVGKTRDNFRRTVGQQMISH